MAGDQMPDSPRAGKVRPINLFRRSSEGHPTFRRNLLLGDADAGDAATSNVMLAVGQADSVNTTKLAMSVVDTVRKAPSLAS